MGTIQIKRAYDPPASSDGQRILVDRLWPRGLHRDKAALDHWAKDLAPSTELRTWFDHRADRFAEFTRRYRAELHGNPQLPEWRERIEDTPTTLLYAARDPHINHAVVLAEFLRRAAKR
jgi:uncharacterized protein YeaO (DUF488 family)